MDLKHLRGLIRDKRNELAKAIIESYNLFSAVDKYRSTLLHYAAQHCNSQMTKYLLEKGCNVNAQDNQGFTPLMEALQEQNYEVIKLLLDAKADIFMTNHENQNSLHILFDKPEQNIQRPILKLILNHFRILCPSNSEVAAKILLEAGCYLDDAIIIRNSGIIEYMLQQGFSKDSNHDGRGQTALHVATIVCHPEIVRVLLKYGADANAQNSDGMSPIYYLSERDVNKQTEVLKLLLDAGAMPLSICGRGVFQCAFTLQNEPREAVRLLLESNLDFTVRDLTGRTALHYLALNRNAGIAEELKFYATDLDVSSIDERGMSPLHLAAYKANFLTLKFLLEQKGAKINLVDKRHGMPALFYAYGNMVQLEYTTVQCIDILLQFNADPQIFADKDGKLISIFDLRMKDKVDNIIDRLKPVVAQLALMDKFGTPINEVIKNKIDAEISFKEYFEQCRDVLDKKITGNLTVYKLLIADEKKMSKYLKNRKLVEKLTRMSRDQKLTSIFPFYSSTLRKLFSRGMVCKILKNKAEKIISRLCKGRLDNYSIITERIIDFYLDEQNLRQLYQF